MRMGQEEKYHTLAYGVVLNERGRSEYATFFSIGMAGAVSDRRFAYAELGSVALAEEVAKGTMISL